MGIRKFRKWLKDKYSSKVFERNIPTGCIDFAIDFNGIIHTIAQKVYSYGPIRLTVRDIRTLNDEQKLNKIKEQLLARINRRNILLNNDPSSNEQELFRAIGLKLISLVSKVRPQEYLILAIDGVAPQAKIAQQRSRRYKSTIPNPTETLSLVKRFIPIDRMDEITSILDQMPKLDFDSNSITPGTDFMIRLDAYLKSFLSKNLLKLPPNIIYSSHLSPGEGEHKIMDYHRSNMIPNGNHVIYGMDADLIMLSLSLKKNNVYLWREDADEVLNIDNLKYMLQQDFKLKTAINDFILIMLLFGNDFIPNHPAINDPNIGISFLLNLYQQLNISLTKIAENGYPIIDWENFKLYLENLALNEHRLIFAESRNQFVSRKSFDYSIETVKKAKELVKGTSVKVNKFNYNRFRDMWYHNEFSPKGDLAPVMKILGYNPFVVSLESITDMVKNYLDSIWWVFNYYNYGLRSVNYRWYYPYYHAPMLMDVLQYIKDNPQEPVDWKNIPGIGMMSVLHQLISVLPIQSYVLFPPDIVSLVGDTSPIVDYFPHKFLIDYEAVNVGYEYTGIPLIPFVNPQRVIDTFNRNIRINPERALIYRSQTDIIIKASQETRELACSNRNMEQIINTARERQASTARGRRGRGRGSRGRGDRRGRGGFTYRRGGTQVGTYYSGGVSQGTFFKSVKK